MLSNRYIHALSQLTTRFDPTGSNRYFIFGSATRNDRFGDVDIGVVGNRATKKNLDALRELCEDSILPYSVDVVDFDSAAPYFSERVMAEEPIVWLH